MADHVFHLPVFWDGGSDGRYSFGFRFDDGNIQYHSPRMAGQRGRPHSHYKRRHFPYMPCQSGTSKLKGWLPGDVVVTATSGEVLISPTLDKWRCSSLSRNIVAHRLRDRALLNSCSNTVRLFTRALSRARESRPRGQAKACGYGRQVVPTAIMTIQSAVRLCIGAWYR